MSLATYTDLQTSVAAWLNRADLSALVPDLIALAESRLNQDLDNVRAMEVKTSLATVANVSTVAVPADMLEAKRLQILGSPNYILKYLSADELAAQYPSGQTGKPEQFGVIAGNVELGPIPDGVYTLELTYFQKLPPLATNSTNWLLTAWPDAYLYAALCAAQPYLMNDARLVLFKRLYKEAVDGINGVDWYSGTTMRVTAR
jgi:hypothetical protein